ncbi:MAG TPA: HIT domain-containing protein [Fimbriimonadales bacterium]|jgi:ATP adenylyltransferase|nr:HIT domain-containing protein [Fimbriimonadales bacterium]
MSERLWAPWRLEYIEMPGEKGEGCIFVDLPAEEDDAKNLILYRGKTAFVILNAFPYTNGHLMVAPYKHTNEMAELADDEMLEIQQLIRDGVRWLTKAYGPEGFNIGANLGKAAGAGIADHLHWHVVPRWAGDTNFMPVTGGVRVLPQSLPESYARLRAVIEAEQA